MCGMVATFLKISFNPTLVRLRRGSRRWRRRRLVCFNPTLVRLRLTRDRSDDRRNFGFNPTLVRLRLGVGVGVVGGVTVFQSHAGSIEAMLVMMNGMLLLTFQSHAGSIEAI